MLAWIDIETTGLDADDDWPLEVACIVTDDAFNEIARFHRVIAFQRVDWEEVEIDPFVIEMHTNNGLRFETIHSSDLSPNVDRELSEFLTPYKGAQLAGSTISFDRSFLKVHFPKSHDVLHYRNFDVTTLNELARRVWPELHDGRPQEDKKHRAMSDIEHSIAVAKYYVAHMRTVPPGTVTVAS